MNRDDRRAKKTEKALYLALSELLCKKEINDITIKELTDTADIHRATFYTHYEDIFDLYRHIENSVFDEVCEIIAGYADKSYESLFALLIDYIYENIAVFRMLLGENSSRSFADRLSAILKSKYIEISQYEIGKRTMPNIWSILVEYHIRGYIALISLLVTNDNFMEEKQLMEMFYNLDCSFDDLLMKYN